MARKAGNDTRAIPIRPFLIHIGGRQPHNFWLDIILPDASNSATSLKAALRMAAIFSVLSHFTTRRVSSFGLPESLSNFLNANSCCSSVLANLSISLMASRATAPLVAG
jgi:hypothetical protein